MLEKQGMTFKLSSKVTALPHRQGLQATVTPANGGDSQSIEADVVLVSVGRVPYTEGLGLDVVGVKKDNKGRIDRRCAFRDQRSRHLCHWRRHCRARCSRTRRRMRA